MSYHIVKKIELNKDEKKVYITGADNNVWPRTPNRWHCSYYDNLTEKEKWAEVELDILEAYDKGNFQAGTQNKYTKALAILRKMPEYKQFDWRNNWDEYEKNRETKKEEYQELLKRAFETKLPKDKFIVSKDYFGNRVFMKHRKNSGICRWVREREKASIFNWKEDAEFMKKCFIGSENWQVEKIK
jgi:hypothetical protein